MFEKLDGVEARYVELQERLGDPDVASNPTQFTALNREIAQLGEVVTAWRELRECRAALVETRALLSESDGEMRDLARDEIASLEERVAALEQELRLLLLPRDPLDERGIVLEIRAGTGGDESALFAGNLFEMYSRYAANRGWRVEVLSASEGTVGGFKEVIASIEGDRVYSSLKWESGVHRVQRVPETEAQGRIHTSACTVAILPEADEIDVKIDPKDLRIDTYRASGAGGQHVNRTDSAVRITHLPTGVVVACQEERSQHKNRDRAMKVLLSRLADAERERAASVRADSRRVQVGSGDRSERIRTYNFPQNRLTDHRINLTLYKLDRVMLGELDEVLEALQAEHQARLLAAEDEGGP
jgi:peptide chain release factor 1